MGIIGGIKNIISGGRDLELKEVTEKYTIVEQNYQEYFTRVSSLTSQIENQSKQIENYHTKSKELIINISEITEKVFNQVKKNIKKYETRKISFDIEKLTIADDVKGLAAGTLKGGSIALGSWSLVSVLGTASTGTAITSLSGVAGTNAILAWFGGGSLAAGGAGIAGGTMVLGGIILLPTALIYAKYKNNKLDKKIQEYTNGLVELEKRISEYKIVEPKLIESLSKMKVYKESLVEIYENSEKLFNDLKPNNRTFIQKIKSFFGFSIYSEIELSNINTIIEKTSELNTIINTDFNNFKVPTND
jgi:CII-binding regulator of phage lambda lysogenization HflD